MTVPGHRGFTEAERQRIIAAAATARLAEAGGSQEFGIAADLITAYHIAATLNRHVAVTTIDHMLQLASRELPEMAPFYGSIQGDADLWAECASDSAVASMVVVCLKRMTSTPIKTQGPIKRAMVALWNNLNTNDRAAFLEMVNPGAESKA